MSLVLGLLDWIEFHPERIKEPVVIVGLVVIVLGILLALLANPIGNTTFAQNIDKKYGKSETWVNGVLRIAGYVLIIVGCIIAVLVK